MMWLLLWLMINPALAQTDAELKAIQDLNEDLPNFNDYKMTEEDLLIKRQNRRFRPPKRVISLESIMDSGTNVGAISAGLPLRDIKTEKEVKTSKLTYVRYFNLEDENGYKYLQNKDGTVTWRTKSRFVEPIKQELAMYVPPLNYTPAPKNIVRAEYDKKLTIRPEVAFYAGFANGNFMADLFNDPKAKSGVTQQYGAQFFTDWKLPILIGGSVHYEKSTYDLTGGGQINYSSISFGPQLKSKDFEIFQTAMRFQTQFRISPFARAEAETTSGAQTFKFNSYDLLSSFEHPIKNGWGEFTLGVFAQMQWLNIKDQPKLVSIRATNKTNTSFGLSFTQVFQ